MIIAKVKGSVVSTNKTEKLNGLKMLIVMPVDIMTQQEKCDSLVAIDTVGAGEGELVMCCSGSSARLTSITEGKPVDLVIVGIIDSMEINREVIFRKYGNTSEQKQIIHKTECDENVMKKIKRKLSGKK